jgi:prepilin-type N-terminal cleavage/methylation domain-containing protein
MARLGEEQGMTLIEVLMASVLMLVVLGATLGTFNTFERNVKTNEQQNEAQEQARRGMDLMARDLRNLASPTPNLPQAVDRHEAADVIFQSEGKDKPVGSLNAQNTVRLRYCLDNAGDTIYRQTQAWTSALPPDMPAATACPASGWTKTIPVAEEIVNEARPLFSYNAADPTTITEVSAQVFVDVDPERSPAEVSLQSSVFLRNQNRAPTASFSWASMPGGNVFLNASASTDPEEKGLTFQWFDMAEANKQIGEGIVLTYKPPAAGWRDIKLVVRDASLEATATENVCANGTGVVCP